MAFQLRVNSPSGEERLIRLCGCNDRMKNVTVQQLKRIIKCAFQTGDNLELVFGAETLAEEALLLTCGVKHMSRIHSVVKLPGAHLMERSGHTETNMRLNSTSSLSETNITENK